MSYNNKYYKLWEKLDELNMTKSELEYMAHLPRFALYRMKIGMPVPLEYLTKICNVLHCELGDILNEVS